MKKLFCYAVLSASLLFIAFNSWSQFLDPSFGSGGKAGPFSNGFFPAAAGEDIKSAQGMTVDNNGRILIAGHKSNGTNQDFAVMRLNADGTPDVTFGDNGVQKFNDLTDKGNSDEYATAIAFNAIDNTCILTGYRRTIDINGLSGDIVVMQLFADGSVNNNFGQQGVRIIDEARNEEVYSIAFGNSAGTNGIFLGGFTNPDFVDFNPARGRIYRLNNMGGSVSSRVVDYAGATCHVYSLAIDANGNILAGGDNDGEGSRFVIARFLPNESFDNSFDGDGIAFVNVGNTPFGVDQIKIQPDGKILMAGGFFDLNTQSNGTVLARLNTDGSVDNNFSGGYAIVPFNYNGNTSSPRSIALQTDGTILVSGETDGTTTLTDADFAIAHLNADGSIDNSFGTNGIYRLDFNNGSNDFNSTLLLQSDGKLLAGTMSKDANSDRFSAGLIRLQFTAPVECTISGPDQLCDGSVNNPYQAPPGMSSYSWSILQNGAIVGATDGPTVLVNAEVGGMKNIFTLSLATTNADGVVGNCSKIVTITPPPVAEITGPDAVCLGPVITYSGPDGMSTYSWTIDGGGIIQGDNSGQFVSVQASSNYTLTLRSFNGCNFLGSKTVTVNPKPSCDINGSVLINAWSTGNIYSGSAGMSLYHWNISGNGGSIVGPLNGQTVSVSANGSGSYVLTLITQLNGCTSNTCQFPVTVGPAVSACTYTQDFYSKKNNKGCSNGTTVSVSQLMLNAFGISSSKVFGNAGTNKFFTLYRSDINSNIFKMLPGFDGAQAILIDNIPPIAGAFYDDKTTWPLVPIPTNGMQKGQISNSLLSQLMTLWFNLGNNSSLGAVSLTNNVLTTTAQTACGNNTLTGSSSDFKLHPDVVAYLNSQNAYSKDVNGLFQLANDVLGGLLVPTFNATDMKDAVEAINNAFNGCRILTGTSSSTQAAISNTNAVARSAPNSAVQEVPAQLEVTVIPNPSTSEFLLNVNGSDATIPIRLRLTNSIGQTIKNMAGIVRKNLRFGNDLKPGIYFVEITQGGSRRTVKIIKH